MTKNEDIYINFSGLAHDHTSHNDCVLINNQENVVSNETSENQCSVIAILRRHPMYDSLILVKKYRACLNGYSLEFPVDIFTENDNVADGINTTLQEDKKDRIHKSNSSGALLSNCSRRKLVSRLIDGDDPMFQHYLEGHHPATNEPNSDGQDPVHPFSQQIDDKGDRCEFVHVPVNGLLHRLSHYTDSGIAVDSRVYAFAMGLKFAERVLTTNSMKEIQETPI